MGAAGLAVLASAMVPPRRCRSAGCSGPITLPYRLIFGGRKPAVDSVLSRCIVWLREKHRDGHLDLGSRTWKETADLVVTDEAGRSVLLVEVQARGSGMSFQQLVQLRGHQQVDLNFPYAMLANPDRLMAAWDRCDLADPAGSHWRRCQRVQHFRRTGRRLCSRLCFTIQGRHLLSPLGRWLERLDRRIPDRSA